MEGIVVDLGQRAGRSQQLTHDPPPETSYPLTTSNAQAAGVGHVLAVDSVALDVDSRGVDVQWSEPADRRLVWEESGGCEGGKPLQHKCFQPIGCGVARLDRIGLGFRGWTAIPLRPRPAGGMGAACGAGKMMLACVARRPPRPPTWLAAQRPRPIW